MLKQVKYLIFIATTTLNAEMCRIVFETISLEYNLKLRQAELGECLQSHHLQTYTILVYIYVYECVYVCMIERVPVTSLPVCHISSSFIYMYPQMSVQVCFITKEHTCNSKHKYIANTHTCIHMSQHLFNIWIYDFTLRCKCSTVNKLLLVQSGIFAVLQANSR